MIVPNTPTREIESIRAIAMCPCGRAIQSYDFICDDGRIVVDCERCHARVLVIEIAKSRTLP